MELKVYRQSVKTRPDGTRVYKGEDALPFLGDGCFFVADGLGGAASIRHQKIKPELFDAEKLMDTLFSGVYEDYSNETFVKYVTDSFFELFAVKDCYTDNINNIKKSGYFASRIVTAIVLHELLCNPECSPKSVFETYGKLASEGKAGEFLSAFGNYFKTLIQDNLRKIAKNANLIYESSYSGLALLGSTLCATVFNEGEDFVEAIYLTAGDSRPYVWDAVNGLCQVMPDQEGRDGGMTNYIRANEDSDFDIHCSYFRFPKPCVLFNASDGCFDSGKFVSQLAFEKLILDNARVVETVEALEEALYAFFVDYGRHDDSSTIAMKFFGFDSFADFKEATARRDYVVENDYIALMPDLLERDYALECEQNANAFPAKISALREQFEAEASPFLFCEPLVEKEAYPAYIRALDALEAKKAAEETKITEAKGNIQKLLARNFSKFRPYLELEEGWTERFYASKIQSVERKYQEGAEEYMSVVRRHQADFDKSVEELRTLLECICAVGVPESFDNFDHISYGTVEECEKTMDSLFSFFEGLKTKKHDSIRKLTRQREEYHERNEKIAQKDPETLDKLTEMVLSGWISLGDVRLFSDDEEKLQEQFGVIQKAREALSEAPAEQKDALRKAAVSYWEEHYVDVISQMAESKETELPESLREKALQILAQSSDEANALLEKCRQQQELFAKYDAVYRLYIGGAAE